MLKNILVTANYTIKGEIYGNAKTEDYTEITELCINSFKKNLVDLDDVIILKGEVDNYHQVFKNIYREIHDIYHSQECNILWVDSDNVCVKKQECLAYFFILLCFRL